MNVERKLATFSKIIEEEANFRRQATLEEIDTRLNTSMAEFKRQTEAEAEIKVNTEKEAAVQLINREISMYAAEKKKMLLAKRTELENKLFSHIENKLLQYSETDEYRDKLIKNIESELQAGPCEIIVTQRDYERLFADSAGSGVISAGNDFFIGGYKVVFKNRGMVMDKTYKTRIDDSGENFKGLKAYV